MGSVKCNDYGTQGKVKMLTGNQVITGHDGVTANYNNGEDGSMRNGKQVIEDEDTGERQNWYFETDGAGKGRG